LSWQIHSCHATTFEKNSRLSSFISAPLTLVLPADLPTDAAAACASVALGSRPAAAGHLYRHPSHLPQSLPIPRAQPGLLPPSGAERPDPRGVNPCGRVGVGTRRRLRPPGDCGDNRGRRDELRIEQLRSARGETQSLFLLPTFPKSSSPGLGLPQIPTCSPLRPRPGLCFAAAATLTHLR
jgi:hypothetical protein